MKNLFHILMVLVTLSLVTACGGQEPTSTSDPPIEGPTVKRSEESMPDNLSPGDTQIRSADGMVMVYVPGGTSQMGGCFKITEAPSSGDICRLFGNGQWNANTHNGFNLENSGGTLYFYSSKNGRCTEQTVTLNQVYELNWVVVDHGLSTEDQHFYIDGSSDPNCATTDESTSRHNAN